jgi:hypothetical protein
LRSAGVSMAALLLIGYYPAMAQDANRDTAVTMTDARAIITTLSRRTGDFKENFDKALDKSLLDGSKLEDKAKHRADDLHDASKKLHDVFNDKKDKNNPKVREEVDKVLAAAGEVNRVMTDHRFTDSLQRQWDLLRSDLNALAALYGLSPL